MARSKNSPVWEGSCVCISIYVVATLYSHCVQGMPMFVRLLAWDGA